MNDYFYHRLKFIQSHEKPLNGGWILNIRRYNVYLRDGYFNFEDYQIKEIYTCLVNYLTNHYTRKNK